MVGVTLRTLMRMTQRRQFGGPNIADKATKGMPGFDAESIKHNYSLVPLLACISIGGIVCVWWTVMSVNPKEVVLGERATEPEKENVAKGVFGWLYYRKGQTPDGAPVSPGIEKK